MQSSCCVLDIAKDKLLPFSVLCVEKVLYCFIHKHRILPQFLQSILAKSSLIKKKLAFIDNDERPL